MQRNILLTGATGAVGAALLPELLSLGFRVFCLVRPKKGQSPSERLRQIVNHPNAIAIAGDITQPRCGLANGLGIKIHKFVHAAADTSLVDAKAANVRGANHNGTAHALELARALANPEFHHVGTTYIVGDGKYLAEHGPGERLTVGTARNAYEASKLEGEFAVRRWGGPYTIHRPAIVVGRSDDGSAPLLDGFYGFVKGILRMKDVVDFGNYRDEKGVRIQPGYRLPVAAGVKGMDQASLNLIQLDWLAKTEAALIALPARGRTYNQCHLDPVPLRAMVEATFEVMNMGTIVLVEPDQLKSRSPAIIAINRLINRELDRFRPYLQNSPHFDSKNIYEDLGADWPRPPAIGREFLVATLSQARASFQSEVRPSGLRQVAAL